MEEGQHCPSGLCRFILFTSDRALIALCQILPKYQWSNVGVGMVIWYGDRSKSGDLKTYSRSRSFTPTALE